MAEKKQDEVFGEDFNLLDEELGDFFESKGMGVNAPEENTPDEEETIETNSGEEEIPDNNSGQEETLEREDTNNSDSEQSSSSPLIPYAKYLKEEGILPNFEVEKFDGTIEGLRDGMYSEIANGIDAYKQTLPEPIKQLINHYEEGVPLKALLDIDEQRVKYASFNEESLSDEDTQKQLVREYYSLTTKLSAEKIEKHITRLSDLQELEDEAKNILPELIAMQADEERQLVEQARALQEQAEQNRLAELETLRSTLEGTEEVIPGTKISEMLRQKIYKNLTTPVGYTEDGTPVNRLGAYRMQNPVKTEILLNYIFEATNEFKDWSIFGKAAKRTVITEIENAARNIDNNFGSSRQANIKSQAAARTFLKEIDNFDF